MPSPTFLHGHRAAPGLVRHASFSDKHTGDSWGASTSAGSASGRPLDFPVDIPEPTLLGDLETQSSGSSAMLASQAEASVVPRVQRARRLCVKNTFLTVEDKRAANLLPRSRTLPTPALLSIDEQGEEKFGNQRMDDPMYMRSAGAPNPGSVGDLSDALGLEPALGVPRPVFLESLSSRGPSPGNSKAQSVSDWSERSQDFAPLDCPMPYSRDLPEGWDADGGGQPFPPWQHEDAFDTMQDLPWHPPPPSSSAVPDLAGSPPAASSSTNVQEGEVTVSRRVKVKNTFLTVEEPSPTIAMLPRSRTLPVPSSLSSLDPCDNSYSQDQDGPILANLDSIFSSSWTMPACAGTLSLTEPTISSKGLVAPLPDYTADVRAVRGASAAFPPRMSMFDERVEEQFEGQQSLESSPHQPIRITGVYSAPPTRHEELREPTGPWCLNPSGGVNQGS